MTISSLNYAAVPCIPNSGAHIRRVILLLNNQTRSSTNRRKKQVLDVINSSAVVRAFEVGAKPTAWF